MAQRRNRPGPPATDVPARTMCARAVLGRAVLGRAVLARAVLGRAVPGLALALLAAASMLGGCAPPRPAGLPGRDALMPRYLAARAERERRATSVEAEVLLWSRVAGERPPATDGRLLVAWPDACRLRIGSLFGTAVDLALRGDSLTALVPSRHAAMAIDLTREDLGWNGGAGSFAVRMLSATWLPPGAAWDAAVATDSTLALTWTEGPDSVALGIDAEGLPRTLEWSEPGRMPVRVRYGSWMTVSGTRWPDRVTLDDRSSGSQVRLRATRIAFGAIAPEHMRVTIPTSAERMSLDEILDLVGDRAH